MKKKKFFDVNKFGKYYETKMVVPKNAISQALNVKSFLRKPGTIVNIPGFGF